MGAFGELLLLGLAERAGAGEDVLRVMRDHLYRPEGGQGVKGADLTFTDAATGERVGIDAKTFDCAPNKRLFAINDKKHEELGGEATHYFCVSGRPLGTYVAVAALIPYVRRVNVAGHAARDVWPAAAKWGRAPLTRLSAERSPDVGTAPERPPPAALRHKQRGRAGRRSV